VLRDQLSVRYGFPAPANHGQRAAGRHFAAALGIGQGEKPLRFR
jgi:hypothetical protein